MQDFNVFVRRDLLAHEKEFEILRDFIKNESSILKEGFSLDSVSEQDSIIFNPAPSCYDVCPKDHIDSMLLESHYICMSLTSLKFLLNLS